MDLLAVWVGKTTLFALRLIGRRGNALPGLVVEKLFPRFLPRALATLPQGVVVVSGTNGKTTTTKMVATILGERYRVLTNDTGSNFVRGTITAVIEHADRFGRLPYDVAVFELDEAWAVRFAAIFAPTRTLLLNVMRDQLDRFGEIDTTARLLGRVAAATTTDLVLNRDDPRIAALASMIPASGAASSAASSAAVSYYGVAPELRAAFPNDDELYGGPLSNSDRSAAAELLALPTSDDPNTTLRIADLEIAFVLRAIGPHNAQNAAGAAALALSAGLSPAEVADGLRRTEPAFGRGQAFDVDGRRLVLQLVKNPAGFRQSLKTLDTTSPKAIVVAINDDYADGRDVSWLWDVDFTATFAARAANAGVWTSGTRAADMAVRLRYDEVRVGTVEPRLEQAIGQAVASVAPAEEVTVFSTYTAMWALHAHLLRDRDAGVITLVHLYPREMNIYGDTGNVVVLAKRMQWRGIQARIVPVNVGDRLPGEADIILGGGGQDAAQGELADDFLSKGADLKAMADADVVMLAICGSYQLLGHEFLTHDGIRIPGVGVLDVTTRGSQTRLIGNNVVESALGGRLVGYENHSGLTRLGPGTSALGTTAMGRGNNGEDRSEGAVYRNVIGTYLHGPVLAKSPRFADELLRRALRRQGVTTELEPLDDSLAEQAAGVAAARPR